ncbi:fumarate hydratase [Hydrogenophaga sp. Root209]|uniref:fumarate hydratase C-terminal domain-containing protein n=1 Tax=Hydrogenophaga sp. Root209 TaxID=1736490 RepID=UPI0006FD650D|nr:fumarate hydratase C-terminal domain-containing protein [Hydrogenophaga sp. Root209]KRB97929.1 fumarate hydratase [Hydrogenophaga sp. Root209]
MTEAPAVSRLHELTLPLSEERVRELRVGDMVTLTGAVTVSIGIPTHKRLAEAARNGDALPVDLRGGAFFHLSTYVREQNGTPVPLYLNPSTSTRYNAWMPDIVRGLGLRLVGGKGGLDDASVAALRDCGCAYLSFLGGGSPLLSRALRGVRSSHWNEYISQFRLLTLDVAALGPATVAIDAHGGSTYDQLRERAQARMPDILDRLRRARQAG